MIRTPDIIQKLACLFQYPFKQSPRQCQRPKTIPFNPSFISPFLSKLFPKIAKNTGKHELAGCQTQSSTLYHIMETLYSV